MGAWRVCGGCVEGVCVDVGGCGVCGGCVESVGVCVEGVWRGVDGLDKMGAEQSVLFWNWTRSLQRKLSYTEVY